jgi:hypothetical protein
VPRAAREDFVESPVAERRQFAYLDLRIYARSMIATAMLIGCIALLGYWGVRQRRGNRRGLEETARFRNAQRWLVALDEDRDPGESFVDYQARTHVRPTETAHERR